MFLCTWCMGFKGHAFVDRNLCKMLKKSIAKKPADELELWQKALLEARNLADWYDPTYLYPVLETIMQR